MFTELHSAPKPPTNTTKVDRGIANNRGNKTPAPKPAPAPSPKPNDPKPKR